MCSGGGCVLVLVCSAVVAVVMGVDVFWLCTGCSDGRVLVVGVFLWYSGCN